MPGYRTVPYRQRGYMRYAAPQSIQVYVDHAKANLRRAQRELAWMEALLALRTAQEHAGQWPARANDESDDGTAYWDDVWRALEKRVKVVT